MTKTSLISPDPSKSKPKSHYDRQLVGQSVSQNPDLVTAKMLRLGLEFECCYGNM
jgi:hypothetical protein